jgi:cytochrome c oxidase subunit 4
MTQHDDAAHHRDPSGALDYASPPVPAQRSSEEHGHREPSVRTYLVVFAALMVLLVVTVAVAFVHLGPLNLAAALAIAIVKATLVILFFMHVIYSSRLTKVFVAAGLFWLLILFGLTLSDYMTRGWTPVSRGWTEHPTIVEP